MLLLLLFLHGSRK